MIVYPQCPRVKPLYSRLLTLLRLRVSGGKDIFDASSSDEEEEKESGDDLDPLSVSGFGRP